MKISLQIDCKLLHCKMQQDSRFILIIAINILVGTVLTLNLNPNMIHLRLEKFQRCVRQHSQQKQGQVDLWCHC